MWNNDKKTQEEENMANSISVFAEGLKLEGDIEAPGDVRVDGIISGNILSGKKVMIGESGQVNGNVNAQEVCVMGEMTGDLQVSGLAKIGSTGKFTGAIVSGDIHIEPGAYVEATLTKKEASKKKEPLNSFSENNGFGEKHAQFQ